MIQRYRLKLWPAWTLALVMIFGMSSLTTAQTNPSLHNLSSGNYTFTEWAASEPAGTYPANMRFWRHGVNDPGISALEGEDYTLAYNLTSGTRILGDGSNGFSMLNVGTGNDHLGAAVLGLNTTGIDNVQVTWTGRTVATGARDYRIRLQYRIGSEGSWIDVPGPIEYAQSTANHTQEFALIDMPAAFGNQSEVYLKWKYYQAAGSPTGTRPRLGVTEIIVQEQVQEPTILRTPASLSNFGYGEGQGPSASQSFTVSGSFLTDNITVTVPTNYEISTSSESGFSTDAITLTESDGTVNETTLYVRLAAGLAQGVYDDVSISITSPGATSETVSLSGQVVEAFEIPYSNDLREQEDLDLALAQGFTSSMSIIPSDHLRFSNGDNFITPEMDFTDDDFFLVEFAIATFGTGSGRELSVLVSNDGGESYETLGTYGTTSTTYSTIRQIIDLRTVNNVENGKVKFVMTNGTGQIRFRDMTLTNDFLVDVDNIADLRTQSTGTTIYRVTNEATLTGQDSFRNTKFFQDDSGFGIQIDDLGGTITTSYNIGDNVAALVGTLSVFEGQLRLAPSLDFGAAVSTGNEVLPVTRTLATLTADDQSRLVRIANVEFENADGVANFGLGGAQRSITDPSIEGFTGIFRNFLSGSFGTSTIMPEGKINVTGLIVERNDGLTIGSRSTDDFEVADKSVTITGNAGWRMLSVPVGGVTVENLANQNWVQGPITGLNSFYDDGVDYEAGTANLLILPDVAIPAEVPSDAYEAPGSVSYEFSQGQGFLWYLYESTTSPSVGFPFTFSVNGISPTSDVSVTQNENSDFTLIGNPFNGSLDVEDVSGWGDVQATVHRWDPTLNSNTGGFSPSFDTAQPFDGFIIEKAAVMEPDLEVTIPVASATLSSQQEEISVLQLVLEAKHETGYVLYDENTHIVFREGATHDWDRFDATKLTPFRSAYAALAILGERLGEERLQSIDSRPRDFTGVLDIPLVFDAVNFGGSFTISTEGKNIPDSWNVYLTDHVSGETVNLRTQDYTFSYNAGMSLAAIEMKMPRSLMLQSENKSRFTLSIETDGTTSADHVTELPTEITLSQNFPNPFNPTTVIAFGLPSSEQVRLRVYDSMGRLVATLVDGNMPAGQHQVTFDASRLASGVYLYRLETNTRAITNKMILIK